jgi:hypothetical protein
MLISTLLDIVEPYIAHLEQVAQVGSSIIGWPFLHFQEWVTCITPTLKSPYITKNCFYSTSPNLLKMEQTKPSSQLLHLRIAVRWSFLWICHQVYFHYYPLPVAQLELWNLYNDVAHGLAITSDNIPSNSTLLIPKLNQLGNAHVHPIPSRF